MTLSSRLWSRISFTNPQPNAIAILLPHGYWINQLILKDLPSTTLALFPSIDGVHVTPVLIARTFLRLRLIDGQKIRRGTLIRDLGRQIYMQYVLACLDHIKARVVLTFVDNSRFFQYLSRMDKQRTYFAIQNGTRTLYCVRDSLPPPPHFHSTISMTNFFCFGPRDIDLFGRHGHTIDSYRPVGSLVGGFYKSVISVPVAKPQFDICLISQWDESFFRGTRGDDCLAQISRKFGIGIQSLNSFLLRLSEETGLTMVVCPRNDDDAGEIAFYKTVFGEKARIAESDRKNFSTYRVVEQSRLAIALNSTTLAETFAWGHKVLWCNVPNEDQFAMPEAGISYFCGDDYDAFKERILTLLKMPQDEYETSTRKGAQYINRYDPANPPHEVIRTTVIEALSKAN